MAFLGMTPSQGALPERLLGRLAVAGFVRAPEAAVTSALAWLTAREHVANGMAALVDRSGLSLDSDAQWLAEVVAEDRTRTDLECVQGTPRAPIVVVEAKLDAALTTEQLCHYAVDQGRRLRDAGMELGLLAVLVPAHRRQEAEQKLASALDPLSISEAQVGDSFTLRGAVWTFDAVFQEIAPPFGEDPDLDQLAALVAVQQALDIRPFTSDELLQPDASRRHDLRVIADRVSAAVTPAGSKLLPSGQDNDFDWRRYTELSPGGPNVAIGIRRHPGTALPAGWPGLLWLRIHRDTPHAATAAQRLARRYPSVVTDGKGHAWLAFTPPPGMGGADIVDELVGQFKQAATAIMGAELNRTDA